MAEGVSLQQQTDRVKRGKRVEKKQKKKQAACVKMNTKLFFLCWKVAVRWRKDESGWDYVGRGQQGNTEQTRRKN